MINNDVANNYTYEIIPCIIDCSTGLIIPDQNIVREKVKRLYQTNTPLNNSFQMWSREECELAQASMRTVALRSKFIMKHYLEKLPNGFMKDVFNTYEETAKENRGTYPERTRGAFQKHFYPKAHSYLQSVQSSVSNKRSFDDYLGNLNDKDLEEVSKVLIEYGFDDDEHIQSTDNDKSSEDDDLEKKLEELDTIIKSQEKEWDEFLYED